MEPDKLFSGVHMCMCICMVIFKCFYFKWKNERKKPFNLVHWLWSNRKYNVYLQIYRSLNRIRLMTLLINQLLLLLDKTVSMYAYMSKNSNNSFWSIEYKHLLRTANDVVICFISVLHFTAVVIYMYFYSTSITCVRRCY